MDSSPDQEVQFEEAYVAHADSIRGYLLRRTSDPALADDLTSETFAKAWSGHKNFSGEYYKAWLYRIAQNLLIDHWRKHKAAPLEDADSLASDIDVHQQASQNDEAARLHLAVKKLEDPYRTIIMLRFMEGLDVREVAIAMDLREGNVRTQQHRALKKLQAILNEKDIK